MTIMAHSVQDVKARVLLEKHHWLYWGTTEDFSRDNLKKIDPHLECSWWPDTHFGKTEWGSIFGIRWGKNGEIVAVMPQSAAEKAGVTVGPIREVVLPDESRIQPDPAIAQEISGAPTIKIVGLDGSITAVTRSSWSAPDVWLDGEKIRFYQLGQNSGTSFTNLDKKGVTTLDLRDAPGGYTNAALEILGMFLGPDRVVGISRSRDEFGRMRETVMKTPSNAVKSLDAGGWSVLVNKGTASASEIIALTLGRYGAKVVGGATYGKRSSQDHREVGQGEWIHLTVSEFRLDADLLR